MFSNSICLGLMLISIKLLSCRFEQALGPVNEVTPEGCFETVAFWHSSKNIFRHEQLRKYLGDQAGLFFLNR